MYYLGWDVQYPYTADLMLLNFCSPPHGYAIPELEQVSTLLHPDSWEASLAAHPDRAYVQYICQGLREGFRVGFHWDTPLASATRNMHSTSLRPAVISEYIGSELAKGRMLGPFPPSWKRHLHINRFGLIPKGHNTGKYRLITDLSHPRGSSVNDGIDPALTSLTYITVDSVMEIVQQLGKGSLLAKMDIESAYRLVPVHPAGCGVGRTDLCGSHASIRTQVSSKMFYCGGRLTELVPTAGRDPLCLALLGWLHRGGATTIGGMPASSRGTGLGLC